MLKSIRNGVMNPYYKWKGCDGKKREAVYDKQ